MGRSPWDDDDNDKKNLFDQFKKTNKNFFDTDFSRNFNGFPGKYVFILFFGLILVWLISGFYKIDEGERSVILRFGKFSRTASPGLNYHLPYPFEIVIIENVSKVRRVEIGYRSRGSQSSDTISISNESTMLTGDENIVNLDCNVIWYITDLQKYIFNIANQENAVRYASESAIREVIGETPISSILSTKKEEIAGKILKSVQNTMDYYDAGIKIQLVQLLRAEPPAEVIDAYRDVQTARADKERLINQAEAYRNGIIPRARGDAARIIQTAEGYSREVITRAEGDALYFLAIYNQYKNQPEINRTRMQLDVIEKILKESNKYIVTQGVLPHMPLGKDLTEIKK